MGRNNMFTARANGTIAPASFVKLDTAGPNLVVQAGAGEAAFAISQVGQKRAPGLAGSDVAVAAAAGDVIQLFGMGDVCLLQADGTGWDEGQPIKVGASGGVGTVATGTEIVCAHAIQAAAANEQALVQICAPTPLS